MTPDTVHLIAQEIRNQRAMLTAKEKWARSLEPCQARIDTFQYVNFWRRFYTQVEDAITAGKIDAPSQG